MALPREYYASHFWRFQSKNPEKEHCITPGRSAQSNMGQKNYFESPSQSDMT